MVNQTGAASLGSGSSQGSPQQDVKQDVSEPVFTDPQQVQLWEDLKELRLANQEKLQQLSRYGGAVNHASFFDARFMALMEELWPIGSPDGAVRQMSVHLRFEHIVSNGLDAALAQAGQAQLAAGANLPPEMLRKLAAQAGFRVPAAEQAKGL